jgi:hypothetical protein
MINIKLTGLLITVALLISSTANAKFWDMCEKSFGAAVAYEDKTTNPKFEGTKLFLDGRYFSTVKSARFLKSGSAVRCRQSLNTSMACSKDSFASASRERASRM